MWVMFLSRAAAHGSSMGQLLFVSFEDDDDRMSRARSLPPGSPADVAPNGRSNESIIINGLGLQTS